MVQVPDAMNVAVVPATVQTEAVVEAKLTGRLELAVAESVSGVPTFWAAIVGKVIVCAAALTTIVYCGEVTESPKLSAAVTLKLNVPTTVGVPVIMPVLELIGFSPVGREPLAREYVSAPAPPVAETALE